MRIRSVAKHYDVAGSGQEAQADELADAGAFLVIHHGLYTPFQIFYDWLDNGVDSMGDGVVHHLDVLIHFSSENDGI